MNEPSREEVLADGAAMLVTLLRLRTPKGGFIADRHASASERLGMLIDAVFLGDDVVDPLTGNVDAVPSVTFPPCLTALEDRRGAPDLTFEEWIGKGPRLTELLADEWVDRRFWRRQGHAVNGLPRYVDASLAVQQYCRTRLSAYTAVADEPSTDAHANSISAVLQIAGRSWTGRYVPSAALIESCGAAAPLVARGSDFMLDSRERSSGGWQAHSIGPGMV